MAYQVTECLSVLLNRWKKPTYEKLTITATAYVKLLAYINLVGDYEISGFGRVQKIDDEYYITDFAILKQTIRSTYAEIDDMSVAQFIMSIPEDQQGEWVLDWHSHVRMHTSPSGTDMNNYEKMLEARLGTPFPVIIVNQDEQFTAFEYISRNKQEDIKIYVSTETVAEETIRSIYAQCKEEVQEKCTQYIVQTTKKTKTQGNSWYKEYYGQHNPWYAENDDDEELVVEDDEDVIDVTDDAIITGPNGHCEICGKALTSKDKFAAYYAVCNDCMEEHYPNFILP